MAEMVNNSSSKCRLAGKAKVIIIASNYSYLSLFVLLVLADKRAVGQHQNQNQNELCRETRCGDNGPPIRFPFRLKNNSQPTHCGCGYPGFDLYCTTRNDTVFELPGVGMKFFVREISYKEQKISAYNPFTCVLKREKLKYFLNHSISPFRSPYGYGSILFDCSSNHTSQYSSYPIRCSLSDSRSFLHVLSYNETIYAHDLHDMVSCAKMFDIPWVPPEIFGRYGGTDFELEWSKPSCARCEAEGMRCRFKKQDADDHENKTECFRIPHPPKGYYWFQKKSGITGVTACSFFVVIGIISVILYNIYTKDKNERENQLRIEKFLEDYKALRPSRYTYADIKKITDHFKEKLGEGAYGTVYKGKLSNDILVAVKILTNSKGNGEEFINEVATMGQIHHVNVVRLVGYCADGFNRALIYEFLPNGSLEKYISLEADGANRSLTWETLQDIALGIAQGLEYLHQGCNQRILHFDIKPHNILLDHKFIPKISDFGLAKLSSKDRSMVSMTTARGTIGYIAPEIFSRNFGNVSYKSDVYSFGMLLLEMVGKRKNTDVTKNTDQIYYPKWIYNLLEEGEDLRIQIEGEGDSKIAKKLAIVGLWCVQWHPVSRPTMKVVVQMFEGEEELTMPPNPFAWTNPSESNIKKPARRFLELEAIGE